MSPGWRRVARGRVLALSLLIGCCGLARAGTPDVRAAANPAPTTLAAADHTPRQLPTSASTVVAHRAHHGLQRWGLRLMALGVGAGLGWALLRLGRNAGPVDGRLSTARPPAYRSGSPRRAR